MDFHAIKWHIPPTWDDISHYTEFCPWIEIV